MTQSKYNNAQDVSDVYSFNNDNYLKEQNTLICPYCGKELKQYVEECPYCGHKIEKNEVKIKNNVTNEISKPLYGEFEGNTKQDDILSKRTQINEGQILLS